MTEPRAYLSEVTGKYAFPPRATADQVREFADRLFEQSYDFALNCAVWALMEKHGIPCQMRTPGGADWFAPLEPYLDDRRHELRRDALRTAEHVTHTPLMDYAI